MWPIGHIGIAYLLYAAATRLRFDEIPTPGPTVALLVGALFPDLVDKPLAWYLNVLPTGRTLAHSLLVLVPLCLAVYLVARYYDRAEYGFAFGLGAISHTLIDAAPVLWNDEATANFLLWPLIPVETYGEEGSPSVIELFMNSLSDPYFLSEFVFLGLALMLWNYHRKQTGW